MTVSSAKNNKKLLQTLQHQWQPATWEDYVALRDDPSWERGRVFFDQGVIWFDMGGEGINHAGISDLFISLLFIWAITKPGQKFNTLGRCQLEKQGQQGCAPDLVLYIGDDAPRWQPGESRFVNLDQVRPPDLVGEISDTTLTTDLDQKKKLYAELKIAENWVIDAQNQRVIAFQLQENGQYQKCSQSTALTGLSMTLLEQTLQRLQTESNTEAARWFSQQIN